MRAFIIKVGFVAAIAFPAAGLAGATKAEECRTYPAHEISAIEAAARNQAHEGCKVDPMTGSVAGRSFVTGMPLQRAARTTAPLSANPVLAEPATKSQNQA